MSEKPKYKPEDVLETEGIDKGRIKDVELAQIGAEAEHETRKKVTDVIKAEEQVFGKINTMDQNYLEGQLDQAESRGMNAIAGEVEKRKREEIKSYGIDDDELIVTETSQAGSDFYESQKKLESERKEEAKKRYLNDQDRGETSE